jgi:hypothetical protein
MKHQILVLMLMAATGIASAQFNASINRGDITIQGSSGGYSLLPNGQTRYTVFGSEKSPAHVISKSENIDLTCADKMVILTTADPVKKGGVVILRAVAEKAVVFVREAPQQRTDLTCTNMTYDRVSASLGKLTLAGATKIVNTEAATKRAVTATGSAGVATLNPTVKGNGALQRANLEGPVKIVAVLAETKGTSTYTATGNQLDIVNDAKPPTITLAGNVKVKTVSTDPTAGDSNVEGLDKIVLSLNEKGEVTDVAGEGQPSRTVFHPGKKKGDLAN